MLFCPNFFFRFRSQFSFFRMQNCLFLDSNTHTHTHTNPKSTTQKNTLLYNRHDRLPQEASSSLRIRFVEEPRARRCECTDEYAISSGNSPWILRIQMWYWNTDTVSTDQVPCRYIWESLIRADLEVWTTPRRPTTHRYTFSRHDSRMFGLKEKAAVTK